MPFPNQQAVMSTHEGLAPGLDALLRIGSMQFTVNYYTKTASYSVLPTESGSCFIANAAMTFTLPAVATSGGLVFWFVCMADNTWAITAPAGTLVTDGNAAATTATWSTASHKIGGGAMVWCDGAKWYSMPFGPTTVTVS